LQPHRDFALALGGPADGVDGIEHHLGAALDMFFDRLQGGIDRAVAVRLAPDFLAVHGENNARLRTLAGFAVLGQRDKTILLFIVGQAFSTDQRQNVLIENFALAVGQRLEACKSGIGVRFAFHLDAEVLQTLLELALQPTSSARMIS
jgi:hypothetical protein